MIQAIKLEECDRSVQDFIESLAPTPLIVLLKNGRPRYIFEEIDDFDWEVLSLAHNPAFIEYLEQARQRGKRGGTLSIEEIHKRLNSSQEKKEVLVVLS